ncbi:E3 ubiquitin-protein ligase RNF170 isoform X3 [Anabrus simplex]|uniref:E3 ubiquitin-protein ligase RNF170 isoform X3 n=1 Tax=Anabrus simplex TaxID=316456 RepID=UPI0035A26AA2
MDRLPRAWVNGIGNEVLLVITTMLVIVISAVIFAVSMYTRYYRQSHDGGAQDVHEPPPGYNRDLCPICIETHQWPVETNCGHLFCGLCLHQCYRHQDSFDLPCPLCRKKITLLFICFSTLVDESTELMTQQQEVLTFVNTYNRGRAGFPLSVDHC